MRRILGASPLILAVAFGTGFGQPAAAQGKPAAPSSSETVVPPAPSAGRNVSATGRVMPPAGGRASQSEGAGNGSSVNADMVKAQKAASAREKAWDSKMRRTMGSICSGC